MDLYTSPIANAKLTILNKLDPMFNLTYDSVLINTRPSDISSRFDNDQVNPYYQGQTPLLPICSAPMDSICSPEFLQATQDRIIVFSHRFQTIDQQIEHIKLGAHPVIGLHTSLEDVYRLVLHAIRKHGYVHLLLDVAFGATNAVRDRLFLLSNSLYKNFENHKIYLWAGNVTHHTYEAIKYHCDYVRVGIGGGSACTTRVNTGVGAGNLTAIMECRKQYEQDIALSKTPAARIVADGGIRTNGDICKALVAGAHMVMCGKMFAATHESAAPYVDEDDKSKKCYRGMASRQINEEQNKTSNVSIEGASGEIEVKGSAKFVLDQMEANLRSSMSYTNSHNLQEFWQNTSFSRIDESVLRESNVHMGY